MSRASGSLPGPRDAEMGGGHLDKEENDRDVPVSTEALGAVPRPLPGSCRWLPRGPGRTSGKGRCVKMRAVIGWGCAGLDPGPGVGGQRARPRGEFLSVFMGLGLQSLPFSVHGSQASQSKSSKLNASFSNRNVYGAGGSFFHKDRTSVSSPELQE